MRRWGRLAFGLLAALCVARGAVTHVTAQEGLPGRDIRSWATADVRSLLSVAGIAQPAETAGSPIGPFWNRVPVGPEQREAIALSFWVYNGVFGAPTVAFPDVTPVRGYLLG